VCDRFLERFEHGEWRSPRRWRLSQAPR
jgi:hypothetical protein